MRLLVEDLEVLFPYEYIYPEQYEYMRHLKGTLGRGHCILEMPTGTGKTVTLLSIILAYQYHNPGCGKLVYCTRTVQEMDKVAEELKIVMDYRTKIIMEDAKANPQVRSPGILGICLSSRRNLCIHPEVSKYDHRNKVDALCRNKTASYVREEAGNVASAGLDGLCEFYEGYQREGSDAGIHGVISLDDIKFLGQQRRWCPYFMARHLIVQANVVVYNYHYMLDPKIANLVSKEIEKESIIVFDEAHNIDNICIEALSVTLDARIIRASMNNVKRLERDVIRMEETNAERLRDEYKALVQGLGAAGTIDSGSILASPVLPDDILREAVPGNIRKAKHFLAYLSSIIEFLKDRMRLPTVSKETPERFVSDFREKTGATDTKALRFTFDRLQSLLRTLRISDLDEYAPLSLLTNFATLVSTYSEGFTLIFEPFDQRREDLPDPKLQLCCLDAGLAIKPVFAKFASVVITSGTLSPLDFYSKILAFQPRYFYYYYHYFMLNSNILFFMSTYCYD